MVVVGEPLEAHHEGAALDADLARRHDLVQPRQKQEPRCQDAVLASRRETDQAEDVGVWRIPKKRDAGRMRAVRKAARTPSRGRIQSASGGDRRS